jgi:hypothetical protein
VRIVVGIKHSIEQIRECGGFGAEKNEFAGNGGLFLAIESLMFGRTAFVCCFVLLSPKNHSQL